MTAEQFSIGLQEKLLGQVRLALLGQHVLRDGGSITLTSGVLSIEPILAGANATTVNAGLEAFATAAAIELHRGLRINVISPTILTESIPTYGPFFPGFESVPAERVVLAYQRSVEGAQTGRTYRVNSHQGGNKRPDVRGASVVDTGCRTRHLDWRMRHPSYKDHRSRALDRMELCVHHLIW